MLKGILLALAMFAAFLSLTLALFRLRGLRHPLGACCGFDWLLVPVLCGRFSARILIEIDRGFGGKLTREGAEAAYFPSPSSDAG